MVLEGEAGETPDAMPSLGRRSRRRTQTLEEILGVAVDVMREDGVGALSLSEVARRIGVRQPSLYKYFPSRLAVYDALFRRGAEQVLERFRASAGAVEPGVEALAAGIDAMGRWGSDNRALAELLFWRPVPGFVPSQESYQPALDFVAEIETQLSAAVQRGQLRPEAATEQGAAVLSVLIGGAFSQHAANEPDVAYDDGRFTRLVPFLLEMFVRTYAPEGARP
jgi:AcrR family transcriptional regulator